MNTLKIKSRIIIDKPPADYKKANCIFCNSKELNIDDMAAFSWKPILNTFTGKCRKCFEKMRNN